MIEKEEQAIEEQMNEPFTAAQIALPPRPKRFWMNTWFILGAVIFVLSFTFTLMNNSETSVNLIGATVIIRLPLLLLASALLGAAIEFFIVIGPRSDSREEIRQLKQQIRELKAR